MICVTKKNPYKFTIGFDNRNKNHVKVAGILNEVGKGMTQLIVDAVLAHMGETKIPVTSALGEIELRQMIKQLVSEELKQASEISPSSEEQEKEMNISEEEGMLEMEDSALKNIWNTLDAFRNIGG